MRRIILLSILSSSVTAGAVSVAVARSCASRSEKLGQVTATCVRIVDAHGNLRIILDAVEGRPRVSLLADDGTTGCELFVRDRDTSSGLKVLNHGKPAVSVFQRFYGPPPSAAYPDFPKAEAFGGLIAYGDAEEKRITLTHSGTTAMLQLAGARGGSHAETGVRLGVDWDGVEVRGWAGGDACFDQESERFRLFVPFENGTPTIDLQSDSSTVWKAPQD